jgi:hypothetical protein
MNPQNQKHTKWIEHRGYSGQHPFKEAQCQSGKNSGCYTYEHITVAMLIPGMGLTSASKLFLLKLGISRSHMLYQG